MSKITDIVRKICEESGIECHDDEMVPEGIRSLAANANMAEVAQAMSIDDLIKLMPEIEAKFPHDKVCPNPADVHPATFAALRNVCVEYSEPLGRIDVFESIVLHVRYDVAPWKMHPCTCGKGKS